MYTGRPKEIGNQGDLQNPGNNRERRGRTEFTSTCQEVPQYSLADTLKTVDWREQKSPSEGTSAQHTLEQGQDTRIEREKLEFQYTHFNISFLSKLRTYANYTKSKLTDEFRDKQEHINNFRTKIKKSVNTLYNIKDLGEDKPNETLEALRILRNAADEYRDKLSTAKKIAEKFENIDQQWKQNQEQGFISQADVRSSSQSKGKDIEQISESSSSTKIQDIKVGAPSFSNDQARDAYRMTVFKDIVEENTLHALKMQLSNLISDSTQRSTLQGQCNTILAKHYGPHSRLINRSELSSLECAYKLRDFLQTATTENKIANEAYIAINDWYQRTHQKSAG